MTTAPQGVVRVRVDAGPASPVAWADGKSITIPEALANELRDSGALHDANELRVVAALPSAGEHVGHLRLLRGYTDRRPMLSRLPFSYHRIPPGVRLLLAAGFGRMHRGRNRYWAEFPSYPLDLSADFLADLAGQDRSPFAGGPTPVLLTHDIDSPEGLEFLLEWFLDLDEAAGARSTSFVVPCGWPVPAAGLEEVRNRGHEVGVHGYDHSTRTPFLSESERRRRLEDGIRALGTPAPGGYRAPSLYRTRGLMQSLAQLFGYDSSMPTSGGLFPEPNNGCATARPFLVEGVAEIPMSMPQDASLRFLGFSPDEILRTWIECVDSIADSNGVVVSLTHCEERFCGSPSMRSMYADFLEYLGSCDRFVFSTPAEVLSIAFGGSNGGPE